jgi:hypothetical protein
MKKQKKENTMKMKVMTVGLILASGATLFAMGNKNDNNNNNAMGSRGYDSTYSSGVSTGMMKRGSTNGVSDWGNGDMGTRSKTGAGTINSGAGAGTGAGTGAGAGTGGTSF